MNFTTNANLAQLTDRTLAIGIDVSKEVHVARAFDFRGFELGRAIHFKSSLAGFRGFLEWANALSQSHSKKDLLIGMEPTGVYGNPLAQFLTSSGICTVWVLGLQVHRFKEMEDNSPSKNDSKDARVIAQVMLNGYFRKMRVFSQEMAELKQCTSTTHQLMKKITRAKNQISAWYTQYFPEFAEVFKDPSKKTAYATMRRFPTQAMIAALSEEEIVNAWRIEGVNGGIGRKKAHELKQAAATSIGVKATPASAMQIRFLVDELMALQRQEREAWSLIEALVTGDPDYQALMKIPEMSFKNAAYLLSEVGGFRDFSHPRQIIRLAGFNLTASSSGSKDGQSRISKRGRPGLRRVLYLIMTKMLTDRRSPWALLHTRLKSRAGNPLKPMQSVIALSCKFIRVVWSMIVYGTEYDPGLIAR